EDHRPCRLARLRRPQPLAEHPQRHITLLRPVFAAPDFAALACPRTVRRRSIRERACDQAEARTLDERAARERRSGLGHGVVPFDLLLVARSLAAAPIV